MKMNIYDQAVLEGVATSFPQTEEIIDNGKVTGMTATDVQKILNLKHAWEFILDKDVVIKTILGNFVRDKLQIYSPSININTEHLLIKVGVFSMQKLGGM